MRKYFFGCLALFLILLGNLPVQAATVDSFRWVTRNDARIPFVRLVFDVDALPSVDAVLSKDGKTLEVTLAKTDGSKAKGSYTTNPEMLSSLHIEQRKRDLRVVMRFPQALSKNAVKVFPLKKDPANNKPYRIVIDVPKAVQAPTFKITSGLKGKTIVVDPGHGGSDTGAISPNNVYEKNVTLPIAKYLKPILEDKGARVILTRDTDRDVARPHSSDVEELQARVDVAERAQADVFLSIHIDSFVRPDVNGITAYYSPTTYFDSILAEALHEELVRDRPNFGDRGTRQANFYLLQNSTMPAALVELGFLSNPQEERLLQKKEIQKSLAEALARGLEVYFDRASVHAQ